jgi:hippurate hydrolase
MHVACLIGATNLFAKSRDPWKGTLMAVFQPGEETAQGAKAMIDDGMFKRFPKPGVVLGQHVMSLPSGNIDWRAGIVTSSADSLQIRMFGRGAHGSMPESSIDPVVMAASTVMRLQTIVSRGRSHGFRCSDNWAAAGWHEREHYSGRGIDQIERAHFRRRRAQACARCD